jgi:hypothetical protein|tara:strand:+ start:1577 stop:1906 length:330 start_codon:yes stop_codon:yes gene_type:complete
LFVIAKKKAGIQKKNPINKGKNIEIGEIAKCLSKIKNGEIIQCIDPKKNPTPKIQPLKTDLFIEFSRRIFFKNLKYANITTGKRKTNVWDNPKSIPTKAKKIIESFFII